MTPAPPRRRARQRWLLISLCCLGLAGIVLVRVLPLIILRGTGFTPQGDVDRLWETLRLSFQREQSAATSGAAQPDLPALPPDALLLATPVHDTPQADNTTGPETLPVSPTQRATLRVTTAAPPTTLPRSPVSRPSPTATAPPNAAPSATPPPSATPVSPSSTARPTRTPPPEATPTPDTRIDARYRDLFRRAEVPDVVQFFSAGFISHLAFFSDEQFAQELWLGDDRNGEALGLAIFAEPGIERFCAARPDYCTGTRFRLVDVDFRPDGLIIFGNLRLGDFWSPDIGVALLLQPEQLVFEPVGLVWENTLYNFPPTGPIADAVATLFDRGGQAFEQLQVTMDNSTLTVREIELTDEQLVLVLR